MPVDFASVIRAGQSLVPDIRAQMLQDDQLALQKQQQQLQIAGIQEKQQRQASFRQAAAVALQNGSPAALRDLMISYPEFADSIKPGWEALQKDERARTLTQVGSVYARASSGDAKGAAAILQKRYDADVQAGVADPEDKELIDALNSGDPALQKQATATIGARLAAYDPDKFAETYKALNPTEKVSPVMREYNDRVAQFGKDAADQWLAVQDSKLIPVNPGGSVYNAADFVRGSGIVATPEQRAQTERLEAQFPNAPRYGADQRGGDPSISAGAIPPQGRAIEAVALSIVPGLTVTSRQRSAAHNKAVGGTASSYHLTDQARDFVPPKGMSFGMLAKRLKDAMPGFDVINEGDHVHVEPGRGMGRRMASSRPAQVNSKQQYDKLPKGAQYVAPDGSLRTKG